MLARFDPFDTRLNAAPFELYRRYREAGPVHWGKPSNPGLSGAWYVFSNAGVRHVLKDAAFGREVHRGAALDAPVRPPALAPLFEQVDRWLMFRDPPYHTHLRRPLEAALRRHLAATDEMVLQHPFDAMATGLCAQAGFDLMTGFATPVALHALAALSGLDFAELAAMQSWLVTLARVLDLKRGRGIYPLCSALARDLALRLDACLATADPDGQTFLAQLAGCVRDGTLERAEAISTLMLVLATGQETSRNLICNGALTLLRHPHALERLVEEPELARTCTEEVLRFEPPVHWAGRVALRDTRIEGVAVSAGDPVLACLASANRDPAAMKDPDRFDIARRHIPHTTFGGGLHHCIGVWLARRTATAALRALAPLLADYELSAPPAWRPTILFRSLDGLPLTRRPRTHRSRAARRDTLSLEEARP